MVAANRHPASWAVLGTVWGRRTPEVLEFQPGESALGSLVQPGLAWSSVLGGAVGLGTSTDLSEQDNRVLFMGRR
jgi:hypothetical protein